MPSIHSLLPKLRRDNPGFRFEPGPDFRWSPRAKAIYYEESADDMWPLLIHELAHGLLGHADYTKDVQLLNLERQAWEKASDIAKNYSLTIDEAVIEDHLDTYRDWLHQRSTCPHCQAVGLQTKKQVYYCPACGHEWRVNEARTCALRRYSLT